LFHCALSMSIGVSEHKPNQGVHGDGQDDCTAQPGEPIRVAV